MQRLGEHGLHMPQLGLGTYTLKGAACRASVESAIGLGYRHIDTAQMYGNEEDVGAAIEASGLRAQIHLTTKVWHTNLAPDALRRSFDESLAKLRTDHVDLYLIHWPSPTMAADLPAAMAVMCKLREQGMARAIGVSNFPVSLMRQAIEEIGAPIACNQVEFNILHGQTTVLKYARAHGVVVTAYAPLGKGRVLDNPTLAQIAGKHGASHAQIALAWLLRQPGVAAIPKAGGVANQRANLDALKIELDAQDIATLDALPKNQRNVAAGDWIAWDPPG